MSAKMGVIAADIDKFTKSGTEELQKGKLSEAVVDFESAFKNSQELGDPPKERTCAFNLGALYIAVQQAEKGIEMLQRALPPEDEKEDSSNGDLFYNFALGYESMNKYEDAVKYFELALEEYQSKQDNPHMISEVASKIGHMYVDMQQPLLATRAFGIVVQVNGKLGNYEQQAVAMCQLAVCMSKSGKPEEALQACDDSMVICQRVTQGYILVRIYNELGLTYTKCRDFPKAALCFELALPLCNGSKADKKKKAVIMQNLGAAFNSLGDYNRAIMYQESAAELHAQAGNRTSQGQCFLNLAFSYSQLGDNDNSGECYLHALQAARDNGDHRSQWQALEGLGSVYFNQDRLDKCIQYFQSALDVVSSGEPDQKATKRISAKLGDALQCQQTPRGEMPSPKGANNTLTNGQGVPNVMVNDRPRPPSRQESMMRRESRQARLSAKVARRIKRAYATIALGMGGYDTESDLSISDDGGRRHSYTHPDIARLPPRSSSLDSRRSRSVRSDPDAGRPPGISRRFSARVSRKAPPSIDPNMLRRDQRPLLRSNTFDSEAAMKEYMKGIASSSDDEKERKKKQKFQQQIEKQLIQEYQRTSMMAEAKRANIAKMYDEDLTASTDDPEKDKPRRRRPKLQVGSSTDSDSTLTGVSTDQESTATLENTGQQNGDGDNGGGGGSSEGLVPPPVPSPFNTGMLSSTYEKPVQSAAAPDIRFGANYFRPPTPPEDEADEAAIRRTRTESERSAQEPLLKLEHAPLQGTRPDPKPGPSGEGPVQRRYIEDEEEPLYQTIKSLDGTRGSKRQTPQAETWDEIEDEAPPVPPRNQEFKLMTRAEREKYLFEYQKTRDATLKSNLEDPDDVNLPKKSKNNKSKACIVM